MPPPNTGQWRPGQSGNPAGRPKKERALAAILAATGEASRGRSRQSRNEAAAARLYELLETGRIDLGGGRFIDASAREWLRAFAFVCQHLDGPYRPGAGLGLADEVLDRVLADLAGQADPATQRAAVAAHFGALLAALLQLDDPMLLLQARELQRELKHEAPDPARLIAVRRFFDSQAGEARRAAALFFACDEVRALLEEAASRG